MSKGKKHTTEQIVRLLRQIEAAFASGKTTPIACRECGITEQMYYRWREEFGGLQVDQARRLCSYGRRALRRNACYNRRNNRYSVYADCNVRPEAIRPSNRAL